MKRINLILEGQIRQLISLNYTYRDIIKEMDQQSIKVSHGVINNVKKRMRDNKENTKRGKKKMTGLKLTVLKELTNPSNFNPPTQRFMANQLNMSQSTVNKYINVVLKTKARKKPKVHQLTSKNIINRKKKAPLFKKYLRHLTSIVTSDEAWFFMQMANGVRDMQYVDKEDKNPELQPHERVERYSPKVMVWAGCSYDHKTTIRFVPVGAKLNAKSYIKYILKPFMKDDSSRMFPNRGFWFHQDSAPGHAAKVTQEWAENNGLHLIPPKHWMAKSPDAAPMDYSIWAKLKKNVSKCRVSDMKSFKRAIRKCWKELSQDYIRKVMDAWPKRVGMLIENEGRHIEHLRV